MQLFFVLLLIAGVVHWISEENAPSDLQQLHFNYVQKKKMLRQLSHSDQQHVKNSHPCDFTAGLQLQSNYRLRKHNLCQ